MEGADHSGSALELAKVGLLGKRKLKKAIESLSKSDTMPFRVTI
jgi:hypothetical protein